MRSPVLLLGAALGVGLLLVGITETGTDERPFLAVPVFLLGLVAGLAPLRVGVPTAIVLACLEGTVEDFIGSPARYWKEAFVAALVLQALLARRPRRAELIASAAIALTYGIYILTGTSTHAAAWAAKILLLSAVAGYAVYRLRPDPRVWRASFCALAVAAGANVTVAVWQRIKGFEHLVDLGLAYGDRVRQAGGDLRAFGALTGAAPFSYALALALLAWVAMALSSQDERRLALETSWLPLSALAGIALSIDRIALVAIVAAIVVVAIRIVRRPAALALLAVAPLAAGLVFVVGFSSRDLLAEGFLFRSDSAKARRALWTEYSKELSPFGAGPGASGAAYERSAEPRELPVTFVRWFHPEPGAPPFRWMGTSAALFVGDPQEAQPQSTLALFASSRARRREVSFTLHGRAFATRLVPADEFLSFAVGIPAGRGRALVTLRARPPAEPAGGRDQRQVAIRVVDAKARVVSTQTERIYQRVLVGHGLDVNALAGTEPGVVDNLYLSWLYQYGFLLGAVVGALFVAILLWPMLRAPDTSLVLTARLWGVFVVVGAAVVNIWEEFPTDLLVALVLGQALYAAKKPSSKGD